MSCLYPITVRHPRRRSSKWHDKLHDYFVSGDSTSYQYECETTPETLQVPCGRCSECRRLRAASWRHRLIAEHLYGEHKNALFVTLTIAPDYYDDDPVNLVPQYLRIFWENYRNYFVEDGVRARMPKYWFTTELGDEHGRLHLHGIIWDSKFYIPPEAYHHSQLVRPSRRAMSEREKEISHSLSVCWPFGFNWIGCECSARTMSYITKYITKEVNYDPTFVSRVYCSPGLGRCQLDVVGLTQYIRRTAQRLDYPMVPSSSKRVPAPRYYLYRCLSDLERRQISDTRLARSRDGTIPFSRYLRGQHFQDEQKFNEYRERLYADDVRLGLVRQVEPKPRPNDDNWRNLLFATTFEFNNNLEICLTFNF